MVVGIYKSQLCLTWLKKKSYIVIMTSEYCSILNDRAKGLKNEGGGQAEEEVEKWMWPKQFPIIPLFQESKFLTPGLNYWEIYFFPLELIKQQ